MNDQMSSAYGKLSRADTHLQVLWNELKNFSGSNPYSLRSETNLNSTEQVIRCSYFVDRFTDPPGHWPLLVGDAIQNSGVSISVP